MGTKTTCALRMVKKSFDGVHSKLKKILDAEEVNLARWPL